MGLRSSDVLASEWKLTACSKVSCSNGCSRIVRGVGLGAGMDIALSSAIVESSKKDQALFDFVITDFSIVFSFEGLLKISLCIGAVKVPLVRAR